MTKTIIACLAAAAALLSTPAAAARKGADGYTFATKAMFNGSLEIQVIEYPTAAAMAKAWSAAHAGAIPPDKVLAAFSQLDANPVPGKPRLCLIHVLDPKVRYEPENVGHELMHCIYGDWHPVEVGQ